jgi:hypothetical protein
MNVLSGSLHAKFVLNLLESSALTQAKECKEEGSKHWIPENLINKDLPKVHNLIKGISKMLKEYKTLVATVTGFVPGSFLSKAP